jgi:IS5 family transposase
VLWHGFSRYSRNLLRQHVVLLCLKVKKTTTYRDLVDERIEMPRVRDALNLDSIPAPSTLCRAFDRLEMAVWRVVLNVSLADLPLNGVTGIDASGFERAHATTHCTKRTNLSIQQLKPTLLIDTATNAILDVHVTTTRKHDTQIAPKVVKRNVESIAVSTGDKGRPKTSAACPRPRYSTTYQTPGVHTSL